jgi:hypothetical protein
VDVFETPIDIAVMTTSGEERFRVENNQREQVFALSVSAEPLSVLIDPDHVILRSDVLTGVADGATPSLTTITSLSPNPASRSLTLAYRSGQSDRVDVEVFDAAGRRVLARRAAGTGTETIDTSSLAAGVYFLRLRTGAGQDARKFVVVR